MSTIKIPGSFSLKVGSNIQVKRNEEKAKRRNSKEKKYINIGTDNLLSYNSTTGIATTDKNSNNDDQKQISTAVAVNLSSQSSSIDATLQLPVSLIATSTPEQHLMSTGIKR